MNMKRRFYCFADSENVEAHISQIKMVDDLNQLAYDIQQSGCNSVSFMKGIDGIWALDYAKGYGPFHRHVFVRSDLDIVPTDQECDSWSTVTR